MIQRWQDGKALFENKPMWFLELMHNNSLFRWDVGLIIVSIALGNYGIQGVLWLLRRGPGLGTAPELPAQEKGLLERLVFTPIAFYSLTVGISMMLFWIAGYTAINWKYADEEIPDDQDERKEELEKLRRHQRASFIGSMISMLFVFIGAIICKKETWAKLITMIKP